MKSKELSKEENKQEFVIKDVGSMLIANGMPAFGTKEFNDMCSYFYGGKTKSN